MNKIELVGRLTNKPELRYTGSNIAYCRFTVAINRSFTNAEGERETDFINCIVWRKQAENLCQYQDKGSLIALDGELRNEAYTDSEGNKKYSMTVTANNIEYLGKSSSKDEIDVTDEVLAELEDDTVNIDENFLD